MAITWVGDALLQQAVIGEQQEAFAIGIQPPCWVDLGQINQFGKRSPTTAGFGCELAQDSKGFVEENESQNCVVFFNRSVSTQLVRTAWRGYIELN